MSQVGASFFFGTTITISLKYPPYYWTGHPQVVSIATCSSVRRLAAGSRHISKGLCTAKENAWWIITIHSNLFGKREVRMSKVCHSVAISLKCELCTKCTKNSFEARFFCQQCKVFETRLQHTSRCSQVINFHGTIGTSAASFGHQLSVESTATT